MEADESWRAREALRQFKRAGVALLAVGAFWLWLLLGSAGFIAAIFESPKAMVVVFYGGAVLVLVSLLVALTAIMVLLANWPDKSQREAAYGSMQERASGAVAFVLRQVHSKTRTVPSPGWSRLGGLSLHAVRAYISARLPGLRAGLLASTGWLVPRVVRPAARWARRATGTCRSFAERKMPALQRRNAALAGAGQLPRAEAASIQTPAAGQAGPVSARTSLPVRRPPMPNRPPASAVAPRPLQDRRDIVS
ncbi:hypothetical protein [Arthrobacter crystallopoietes]|uniref:hypothetical protein n=1 Tax=Crystallibacter crystallopoietes TaxID=37928 RepID=UPI0011132D51|nr:hypothetical protein [Arthrobacter crystallopoietes]